MDALGYLDSLKELHRVKIPDAVAAELEELRNAPGSQAPSLAWVERRSPVARHIGRVAPEPPVLDPGELEAIALALEIGATVVMDDRRGRRRARMLGVSLTGTLGVLRLSIAPGGRVEASRRTWKPSKPPACTSHPTSSSK